MHHSRKSYWIICLLLAAMLLPMPAQADGPAQSSIEQLTGTVDVITNGVQLMKSGTDNWLNITIESVIARGDRIRTNATGVALLTWFEDGTTMEVGPNSELVIDEFSGNDDRFVIEASLIQGSLFSSVRRILDPESRYEVLTPSVSATVRGTVFGVYVDDDLDTAVAVTVGSVGVAGYDDIDNEVNVDEGNLISIDQDGDFNDVINISDAGDEYSEFLEELADFDQRQADESIDETGTSTGSTTGSVDQDSSTDTGGTQVNDDSDNSGGPPPQANPGSGNRADQADENANNQDKDK